MINIGWCWTGSIPELLVVEPERFKTPKIVNKDYNNRGVIDCPSYQGFYSNLFLLKSPVSFTATPKDGAVEISSDEVDRVFERVFLAGKLDTPGMGFMYATPLMQAATYVPPSILSKYVGS